MSHKYAQVLFEMMGSQHLPTEDRAGFMQFFDDYRSAVLKSQLVDTVRVFLEKNTEIASFSFEVGYESDDEGGSYKSVDSLSVLDQDGDEIDDNDDVPQKLYEVISDEDMIDLFYDNEVSLTTLDTILANNFSKSEARALDMVDNFERNKLQAEVSPADKKKQAKL